MRYVVIAGAVVVGLGSLLFIVPLLLWGFESAVAGAAIWLLLVCIVFTLIPLAVMLAGARKGMPWVLGKVGGLLGGLQSATDRVSGLAERSGRAAVAPDIWLYSRFAWLQGFWGAIRRARDAKARARSAEEIL